MTSFAAVEKCRQSIKLVTSQISLGLFSENNSLQKYCFQRPRRAMTSTTVRVVQEMRTLGNPIDTLFGSQHTKWQRRQPLQMLWANVSCKRAQEHWGLPEAKCASKLVQTSVSSNGTSALRTVAMSATMKLQQWSVAVSSWLDVNLLRI